MTVLIKQFLMYIILVVCGAGNNQNHGGVLLIYACQKAKCSGLSNKQRFY